MKSNKLKEICYRIAEIENDLMFGQIDFSYDRLLTVMGAGHPADILDSILAPVFWPASVDANVNDEAVRILYKNLTTFKNDFRIKELTPIISDLRALLEENGVEIAAPKMKLVELKKRYIGKTLDKGKLRSAGEVWNLELENGKLNGHFYWRDERHTYYDEFSIAVDEEMIITDIDPLRTHISNNGIKPCRYTLTHNGEFNKLLKAATD